VKVRDDVKAGDYRDPGWYRHPANAVAREFTGAVETPTRAPSPEPAGQPVEVRKPGGGHGGHHH